MSTKVMGWVWDQHDWDQGHLAPAHDRAEQARATSDAGYVPVPFRPVTPSALKLVLLAIADHTGHDGANAWPSIDRLCEMTEMARRTVQRAVRRLADLGYVTVAYQRGGPPGISDDARPNQYTVRITRGASHGHPAAAGGGTANTGAAIPDENRAGCPTDTPRGDQGTPGGCPTVTPRGDRGSRTGRPRDALTVLEPSLPLAATSGGRTSEPSNNTQRRPRDGLWDAVVSAVGHEPATTSERRGWNQACKQLRDADATPEEVTVRARRWPAVYPGARLTPSALARHWGELAPPAAPPRPRRRDTAACAACDSTGWVTGTAGDVTGCPACEPALTGSTS